MDAFKSKDIMRETLSAGGGDDDDDENLGSDVRLDVKSSKRGQHFDEVFKRSQPSCLWGVIYVFTLLSLTLVTYIFFKVIDYGILVFLWKKM